MDDRMEEAERRVTGSCAGRRRSCCYAEGCV